MGLLDIFVVDVKKFRVKEGVISLLVSIIGEY